MKKNITFVLITLFIFLFINNYGVTRKNVTNKTFQCNASLVSYSKQPTIRKLSVINNVSLSTPKPSQQPSVISLVAVGDDLIHSQIIADGKKKNGTYNFNNLFRNIQSDIKDADISIINQETILSTKKLGYTGYPLFGSPVEIGKAIHKAGFDVVLHATNHSMDKGYAGIKNTLNFWKKYTDTKIVGIYDSKKEANEICIVEKNGIKVAILNYTFSLNGISIPKDKPYLVNTLYDKKKLKKDISKAKSLADIVIVCPHWGTEYILGITSYQKNLTNFFYENNVDIVIGTHPHVIEPVKWIQKKNNSHKMLVYYSLGNFISSQADVPTMLGGMAKIQITKDGNKTYISDASIIPLVTHYNVGYPKNFTTYKLKNYNKYLTNKHGIKYRTSSKFSIETLNDLCKKVLGKWYN